MVFGEKYLEFCDWLWLRYWLSNIIEIGYIFDFWIDLGGVYMRL